MAVQTLGKAQAFGPGSDLWVIPASSDAAVFKKIDWYLNFQLLRARLHSSEELPPQLKTIITENQLPSFSLKKKAHAPLMVAADMHFPAKTIVELSGVGKGAADWIEHIHQMWLGLDRPSLRVFLPPGLSVDDFKEAWSGPKNEDLTVVLNS